MKLTVICVETPYPPSHGARVDIWRRLRAFQRRGVELQVVYWTDDERATVPDPVREVAHSVVVLPVPRHGLGTVMRLPLLARYPWTAARRTVAGAVRRRLATEVRDFGPDAIWLEGIWMAPTARMLARSLGVPLFVRSHNVEHVYMANQRRLARGLKQRLQVSLACLNLHQFEADVLSGSALFFDISVEDLAFWRSRGLGNGHWLAPLLSEGELTDDAMSSRPGAVEPMKVVFLGNLTTPNNVAGVLWLVREVFPLLRKKVATTRLIIAGSMPTAEVRAACESEPGVQLVVNPPSAAEVLGAATVLVNPAPWSSGVNLKSLDMLHSGRPVVSTSMGVKGLPDEIKSYFQIADTPEEFAAAVVSASQLTDVRKVPFEVINRSFGDEAIAEAVKLMQGVIERSRGRGDVSASS